MPDQFNRELLEMHRNQHLVSNTNLVSSLWLWHPRGNLGGVIADPCGRRCLFCGYQSRLGEVLIGVLLVSLLVSSQALGPGLESQPGRAGRETSLVYRERAGRIRFESRSRSTTKELRLISWRHRGQVPCDSPPSPPCLAYPLSERGAVVTGAQYLGSWSKAWTKSTMAEDRQDKKNYRANKRWEDKEFS
ncbi:hypothetical protein K449DRAFT_470172 [Hypoxylon sp. EC38]|nr:hypothetical protein K449DRAFT_470172 [Hypoxylon sp. EC38]